MPSEPAELASAAPHPMPLRGMPTTTRGEEVSTPDLTLRIKIDVSPLVRAMNDAGVVMRNMVADARGLPRPPRAPYPKRHSGMTARQYRAARRRYARERRGYAKALAATPPRRPDFTGFIAFARAAQAVQRRKEAQ